MYVAVCSVNEALFMRGCIPVTVHTAHRHIILDLETILINAVEWLESAGLHVRVCRIHCMVDTCAVGSAMWVFQIVC